MDGIRLDIDNSAMREMIAAVGATPAQARAAFRGGIFLRCEELTARLAAALCEDGVTPFSATVK